MNFFKKLIIILLLLKIIVACDFASGSYPYVEVYEIPVNESKLIAAINEFKNNNPEFIVPDTLRLIDGRDSTKRDHWFHVYFFYKKEKQIVYAWTQSINKHSTTFALVSINDYTKTWIWKRINKDFDAKEDEEQKKKFEERIVNKIRAIL